MNWDQIAGNWKQATARVKQKWAKLNDDDMALIRGKRDELVGKIQARYGVAKEAAEEQVDEFVHTYKTRKAGVRQKVKNR